jgi:SAM-dependent methyltransferase
MGNAPNYQELLAELTRSASVREKKSRDELLHLHWYFHPRFRYFKSLPLNSKLLDVGANSGGLYFWKHWGEPAREDLALYAVDLQVGSFFKKYVDFQICDLEKEALKFEAGFFDAILISHVLEHLSDPEKLLREIFRVLKIGGRIYIEMPTVQTLQYPTKKELLAQNINVSILNFYDDQTHKKTLPLDELRNLLHKVGLETVESGVIENSYLQNQLFAYGMAKNDQELTTYAVWSKFRWAQYAVAQKIVPV